MTSPQTINMDASWSIEASSDAAFIQYRGIDVVGFWTPHDKSSDTFIEVAQPEQFRDWTRDFNTGSDTSDPYTVWGVSDLAPNLMEQAEAIDEALEALARARRKEETLLALKEMADDFGAVEEFLTVHGYTKEET